MTDGCIHIYTDGYTYIQIDTQIYRWIHRYTDGYTDIQMTTQTYRRKIDIFLRGHRFCYPKCELIKYNLGLYHKHIATVK
jgi:hypothetical protein